jgi:hypothetical protein
MNLDKFLKYWNKFQGEDGIISELYQLYWQDIKNEFSEVLENIFKFEYTQNYCRKWFV